MDTPLSMKGGLEELEIGGRIKTIQTIYSIVEIGRNTEKSLRDLRKIAVAKMLKDYQLTLGFKILQGIW